MRIAIVNDLKVSVELLKRIVTSRPNLSVAWIAYDGSQAIELAKSDTPDLILMDLIMPEKNGVEAINVIMNHNPCPILVVSACIDSSMNLVFEAMGRGALDVVSTPSILPSGEIKGANELLKKIDGIRLLVEKTHYKPQITAPRITSNLDNDLPPLIIFGASTGGPTALSAILKKLEKPLPAACVIVQHVDQEFIPGFVQWLREQTGFDVVLAEAGQTPQQGTVYVSNTQKLLTLTPEGKFHYSTDSNNSTYTPTIDHFFNSVSKNWPQPGIATLLTGMGSDGGAGLLALKTSGWYTIAEDESSCVVYGMPKKAVELGATCEVAPLKTIPQLIWHQFNKLAKVDS